MKKSMEQVAISLWRFIGGPNWWALLVLIVFIGIQVNGVSLVAIFWFAVTLLAYFLARIAVAVEKIARQPPHTESK